MRIISAPFYATKSIRRGGHFGMGESPVGYDLPQTIEKGIVLRALS